MTDKQAFAHTDTSESPLHLTWMSLDRGRKPEDRERTPRTAPGQNPEPVTMAYLQKQRPMAFVHRRLPLLTAPSLAAVVE